MSNDTSFLPESLRGKTVGMWTPGPTMFDRDLERLSCRIVPLGREYPAPLADSDPRIDFFVLDGTHYLGGNYISKLRQTLEAYRNCGLPISCYAILPYALINHDWDVVNNGVPLLSEDCLPSAPWLYHSVLEKFAVRAVANIKHKGVYPCIVIRVTPLKRTIMCIMAQSGQGKTTLVRQMTGRHSIYHVSSDYLLSNLINKKTHATASAAQRSLHEAIATIDPEKLWGRFFRVLDEDHTLLAAFLTLVKGHLDLANDTALTSFDIDLRQHDSQEFVQKFFQESEFKVWRCST